MARVARQPKSAVLGKIFYEVFPSLRDTRLPAVIGDSFQVGSSSILTHSLNTLLPLRGEDGGDLLHNVIVRPISSDRSEFCLLQINDVTVPVMRERVLRERQNARYHAIVDSAPDAIVTTDLDRTIQWVNGAAEHVFGYAPAELLGQKIDILLAQDGSLAADFFQRGARRGGEIASGDRPSQGRRARLFRRVVRSLASGRAGLRHHDLARRHRADGGRPRAAGEREPSPGALWKRCRNWSGPADAMATATISIRNGRATRGRRRTSIWAGNG